MLKEQGVVDGLYKKLDDFVLATSFDIGKDYYIKSDNGYSILHTIKTLAPKENYFYKSDNVYTSISDSDDITEFTIDLVKQNKNTLEKANTSVRVVFTNGDIAEVYIDDLDSLIFTKNRKKTNINENIKTNGDLWYNYHNKIEDPALQTRAAGIEAQLTVYWSQAYTASKYCDYFLPET
jgi:hypothetical protein